MNDTQPPMPTYIDTVLKRFDEQFVYISGHDKISEHWITGKRGIEEYDLEDVKAFLKSSLEHFAQMVEEMEPPSEDDEETTLYGHCQEGDHWQCAGFGENGDCICKCHAYKKVLSLLTTTNKEGET